MRPSGLVKTTFPVATRRSVGLLKMSISSAKNFVPESVSISTWPVRRTWSAEICSSRHCAELVMSESGVSGTGIVVPGAGAGVWASTGAAYPHRKEQRRIRESIVGYKREVTAG